MPAKKARRISKQNREILRRNYNKKLIQLNKLIYELSWYSSEVNLQREFIQNFFNKQIDYSISIYRNQVKKLQDSSVDDYNFILERTDRFYKRKYQKMKEAQNDDLNVFSEISSFEKNVINEECQNLQNEINELDQKIKNEQDKLEEEIHKWQQTLNEKVKEEESKGKKKIDDYLVESAEKMNECKKEYNLRIKMLQKNHNEEIEKIQKETQAINSQINSTNYKKINTDEYKNIMQAVQNQYKYKLVEIKNKINDLIKEINIKSNSNQAKYKEMVELISKHKTETEEFIDNLNSQFRLKIDQNNSQILLLKSEFEKLKNNNERIISEHNHLINQNSISTQSSLDYLFQSLQTKFEIFQQKIDGEEQKKKDIAESIMQETELMNKDLSEQSLLLTRELNLQKMQFKREVESYQKTFYIEKEKMINQYKEEIEKAKNGFLLQKNSEDKVQNEYVSMLNNLRDEKELLISTHQNDLTEFDQETENIINQLLATHELNMKNLQSQIQEMKEKDKNYYSNKIAEVEKENQEKIENMKKEVEDEYQLKIESLLKSGYSKSEYEKLEKSYLKEFESLQNKLNEANVIIPESELFKNMARVISDLRSELEDHEVIIQSRSRCLKFEWQTKINKENERFSRSPFNSNSYTNPRARDQMKKSLLSQIENAKKEKNNLLSKLSMLQAQIERKNNFNGNEDEEIKYLQSEQDQLYKQKIILVQKAILNKEEMIKNMKEEIDQVQCIFGQERRNLMNKINDQKSDFNSSHKKLNDLFISHQQEYNQEEQNENNSFQSKLNSINLQFCEKKSQLISEINELNDKSSSISLSSSTSSISSLITQETRDAWTKQRMDCEAKVQCLKDQISSEIARLNSQKEEISQNLDTIWKEKLDRKMRLTKIMSNWSSRSSDADIIAKLEANLKALTYQFNIAMNDMKKYKNLCIEQERQVNKKFGGMPDVVLLK